ncbi:cytidylate kinase [Sulfurifustis variabilis]|uniref:Cytidylate kinase n=1 Tax=Sulfurifustis variabilis TaxID=1675686 RepID=A0A1B4V7M7_9GAMM|nr:(d)CMP kinase [Sulfurifustis variabilis]BAU48622.1 cytidylate kinase [Sulfurifustis variabilis]
MTDNTDPRASAPVVTLDGPSGSGKGTVGQVLAARLGWYFLDSGALYRLVGLLAHETAVRLDDGPQLARLAQEMHVDFGVNPAGTPRVVLNGVDVGDRLRTEEAGDRASRVAAVPEVRQALLEKQRAFRRPPGLVADGRDMGTTVFPDALLKVFVTASAEQRAERRYKQLKEKGFDVNLARLLEEIRERDARDAARAVSPLRPAADAQVLDTSDLSISEVVDRIEGLLHERR